MRGLETNRAKRFLNTTEGGGRDLWQIRLKQRVLAQTISLMFFLHTFILIIVAGQQKEREKKLFQVSKTQSFGAQKAIGTGQQSAQTLEKRLLF